MSMVQDLNERMMKMYKISLDDFKRIMEYDITENQKCIEIEFSVDNSVEYQAAWLGKMVDRHTMKVEFWFGLTEDGSQAYEFDSLEDFINAGVFHGKNITEIWDSVSLISIDACNIQERLLFYLG